MGLSLILMIIVNFLAVGLPLNNRSTASISDSYHVFFVPAGYVFSIWGLIYITQIITYVRMFSQAKKYTELINKITPLFILGNIANAVWLFCWHYLQINLAVIVMLVLLVSLIYVYCTIKKYVTKDWMLTVPAGIYLGWISVATIANISDALYAANWDGLGIEPQIWAGIMIIVASFLAFFMVALKREFAYAAVIVWAIVGIAVKFPDEGTIVLAVLAGIAFILLAVLKIVSTEGVVEKVKPVRSVSKKPSTKKVARKKY